MPPRLVSLPPVPSTRPPQRALEARRAELLAMPDAEVERRPTVDAAFAAELVIGCLPRIERFRSELTSLCGPHAGEVIDALLVDAHAANEADVALGAMATPPALAPMHRALLREHKLLFTDAQSLANRELLDASRLEAVRSTQGYRTVVHNTLVLVALFRERWSAIESVTPVTTADLARAEAMAGRMLTALGERQQGGVRSAEADLRARALTALVRRYDELRRMMSYLRWHHGDADAIAPSLYARRARARKHVSPERVDPSIR